MPLHPPGLTIIDDAPDDLAFNPFEYFPGSNSQPAASGSNASSTAPTTPKYADVVKKTLPFGQDGMSSFSVDLGSGESSQDDGPAVDPRLCQFHIAGICRFLFLFILFFFNFNK